MAPSSSLARRLLAALAGVGAGALSLVLAVAALEKAHLFGTPRLAGIVMVVAFFGSAIFAARWVLRRPLEADPSSPSPGPAREAAALAAVALAGPMGSPSISAARITGWPAASPPRSADSPPGASAPPAPPPSPDDPVAAALAVAQTPPPKPRYSPLLLIGLSLASFTFFGQSGRTGEQIALLVAVLFFHEAGHVAGMRLFGYRDLRMLFIPFVGALASGRKPSAPGWQQAIVLLLGPLPGLAASFVLYLFFAGGTGRALAEQLLVINGLNLLPLVPFDGGRFVQKLFVPHPRLEAAFSVVSSAALGGLALYGESWLFVAVSAWLLARVPFNLRIAKEGAKLRAAWAKVPPLDAIAGASAHDLYESARRCTKTPAPTALSLGHSMRQIHERAASDPIAALPAVALSLAYAAGFGVIFVTLLVIRLRR